MEESISSTTENEADSNVNVRETYVIIIIHSTFSKVKIDQEEPYKRVLHAKATQQARAAIDWGVETFDLSAISRLIVSLI